MTKQIKVTNLPLNTSEKEVETLFLDYGVVARISIKADGRTMVAYVDMVDDAQADSAIKGLANAKMGAQSLNVNEARPRESFG